MFAVSLLASPLSWLEVVGFHAQTVPNPAPCGFQDTSCLPAQHHSSLLEHAAFLIDVDARGREGGGVNVEHHDCSSVQRSGDRWSMWSSSNIISFLWEVL